MSDMVETRGSSRKEKLTVHSDEEESNAVEDKVADEEEYSSLKGSSDSEDKMSEQEESRDEGKKTMHTPSSSSRPNKSKSEGPPLIQPRHAWQKDQKVNVYSKTKLLGVLHKKMTDKQQRIMKKSFLWNFWELPTTNFPTQLLLQIIRRRVHNDDKSLLTFNICGYTVDFTLEDFATITGLICDDVKFTNLDKLPASSIEKKFFKTHTIHSLKALIEEIDDYDFQNDKMSIKVAKLAMLESIVIANQQKNTISDLHFRLVEDDDLFESYPWGRISYDMLRQSVTRAVGSSRSLCMAVGGCAYALIYWAFERIPALSIGEKYARRISYDEPRVLAWDVMRHGTCKELDKDVFNDQIVVESMKPVLNPEKYYYLNEFQQSKKRKGKSVQEEVHEPDLGLSGKSDEDEETDSDSDKTHKTSGYIKLSKKLDKISAVLDALATKVDFISDIVYMRHLSEEKERRNVGRVGDGETEQGRNTKDGQREDERFEPGVNVEVGHDDTVLDDDSVGHGEKDTVIGSSRADKHPLDHIDQIVTNVMESVAQDFQDMADDPTIDNTDLDSQERLSKRDAGHTTVGEAATVHGDTPAIQEHSLQDSKAATVHGDTPAIQEHSLQDSKVASGVNESPAIEESTLQTTKQPCVDNDPKDSAMEPQVQTRVERPRREKNRGKFVSEPYTDAFGSTGSKAPKATKKRSQRTGKAKTPKHSKKGKLEDVSTEEHDVDGVQPSGDDEPNFNIKLTAAVNEIRGADDRN